MGRVYGVKPGGVMQTYEDIEDAMLRHVAWAHGLVANSLAALTGTTPLPGTARGPQPHASESLDHANRDEADRWC